MHGMRQGGKGTGRYWLPRMNEELDEVATACQAGAARERSGGW